MPHDYRSHPYREHGERAGSEREHWRRSSGEDWRRSGEDEQRRGRMRPGEDRDPYRTGDERRYWSEWDQPSRGAFEGQRSYPRSGYREETGYQQRYRPDEASRPNDPLWRRPEERGAHAAYEDWEWRDQDRTPGYYGTGVHYGGGYGTAPSTRTAGSASLGAVGYGRERAWSDSDDWTPDPGALSGSVESYGRSPYGAQGAFGRETGATTSYRGRGPKGYERSDERLKEMICERLTDDPRIDASDVSVDVQQRVVKLTGTVTERRTKYEIEDLLERMGGVKDVDNQLRVQPRPLWSGADSGVTAASSARSAETKATKRP